jgi:D-glycero-alpha-D-manno-heptose-7-phosphate kinase
VIWRVGGDFGSTANGFFDSDASAISTSWSARHGLLSWHHVGVQFQAIVAKAPVRVCDLGGWTDTWFAKRGLVCNIAMGPGVTVQILPTAKPSDRRLVLAAHGIRIDLDASNGVPGHPMIEAIVRSLPNALGSEIRIDSTVPPGSGVGTSASVGVALVAALRVHRGLPVDQHDVAVEAHRLETSTGMQSGVQDHVAAAFGGISLIDVDYPGFVVQQVCVSEATLAALGARLQTVYFGRPHLSSAIHSEVIRRLEDSDPEPYLRPIRELCASGAAALAAGDIDCYTRILMASVEAQRMLDAELVSADADRIVGWCGELGAGAKVNGAGGDGGSLTVLLPSGEDAASELLRRIDAVAGWRRLMLVPEMSGVTVSAVSDSMVAH